MKAVLTVHTALRKRRRKWFMKVVMNVINGYRNKGRIGWFRVGSVAGPGTAAYRRWLAGYFDPAHLQIIIME